MTQLNDLRISIPFQSASALASGRYQDRPSAARDTRFNPRPLSRADDGGGDEHGQLEPVSIRVRSRERTMGSKSAWYGCGCVSIRVRSRERTILRNLFSDL